MSEGPEPPPALTLAADGPLLIVLSKARDMLAATDEWQQISSTAKIHFDALPPPTPGPQYTREQLQQARPFALLWNDDSAGYRIDQGSQGPDCPAQRGRVAIQIQADVPAHFREDPEEVSIWANRMIGRIVRTGDADSPGLWDLSRLPGNLPITMTEVHGYERTTVQERHELGDAIVFELSVVWSTE